MRHPFAWTVLLTTACACHAPKVHPLETAVWTGYEEMPAEEYLFPGHHAPKDHGTVRKEPVIPQMRKEFRAGRGLRRATLYIAGLGQYEALVNGIRVSPQLAQGWSQYSHHVLYDTYDITPLLGRDNAVGVTVGNGFHYISSNRYAKLELACGYPKLLVAIELEYPFGRRETIVSDSTWTCFPSPVTYSNIFGGEDYDATRETPGWALPGFDDHLWRHAVPVSAPGGELLPNPAPPMDVDREIPARTVRQREDGVQVIDFGQNASGVVRLDVSGSPGARFRVYPGELLDDDGRVTQQASGGPHYYEYTLSGKEQEQFCPKFTYYGLRYAEIRPVSGTFRLQEATLLHTRSLAPMAGGFSCSSPLMNDIYNLIDWAVRSNMQSVFTDCPHREKLGWLEQDRLMGNAIRYGYRIDGILRNVVLAMEDSQREDGLVSDIAPEYVRFAEGFADSPEWGSSAIDLPWFLYKWYGDRETLRNAWPMMTRYMDYLATRSRDGLLEHGLGDWCDLGPLDYGPAQLTPISLTATATWYQDAVTMAAAASVLGLADEEQRYQALAGQIRTAFNGRFYDAARHSYATGSQTALSMPLCLGLVPPEDEDAVYARLLETVARDGYALTAGDIGFHYLVWALGMREAGCEVLYRMINRTDVPGYGYQLAHGATALTESWPAHRNVSNNHLMLGHILEWFYTGLLGICDAPDAVASDRIRIHPVPVGDLTWAAGWYDSPRGRISVRWEKMPSGEIRLETSVPDGVTVLSD